MEIHGVSVHGIWSVLKWLPPFLLRFFFPKERLAHLFHVDLSSRNESARIDLGEMASYQLYLTVINLSPFNVELDRAEIRLIYGGGTMASCILKKETFAPGKLATLRVSGPINDGAANQIARNIRANARDMDGMLEGFIELNCRVHPFCKIVGALSGVRPIVINESARELK
jgi:hypothetical protein